MKKKLKLQEFRELGFIYRAVLSRELDADQQIDLTERLINEVLVPRGLQMGGSLQDAFVAKRSPGSASEDDLQAVRDWFGRQPDIEWFDVGPLSDAWYGNPDEPVDGTPADIVITKLEAKLDAARLYLGRGK